MIIPYTMILDIHKIADYLTLSCKNIIGKVNDILMRQIRRLGDFTDDSIGDNSYVDAAERAY